MPQLFPPTSRSRFRHVIAIAACALILVLGGIYYNAFREWEYSPVQPVEFSHKTHIQLGLNCSFCHPSALRSPKAGISDTQSCMTCHRHIMPDSPRIAPLRKAVDRSFPEYTGDPINWIMVNTWAGHAKFSHQAHTSRGVGCTDCHGNVERMNATSSPQNRGMRWCIECHRNPAPKLRPLEAITESDYSLKSESLGKTLQTRWKIAPPVNDCSACHY